MIGDWTRVHWIAIGCCLVAFVAAGLIADNVFEYVPHLEDEVAYLFQAQVFASGRLYADAPFHTNCFFAPFVLDHQGRRFGKYSPGWPALLSVGVRLGQPWWVNAGFAALVVALTFRLARDVADRRTSTLVDASTVVDEGAVAAALAASSPFVLFLAGSLMSHTSCLAFVSAFVWCFQRSVVAARRQSRWALIAGAMLGVAFVIRPYTALAVGFPSLLYALWRWWRAGKDQRTVVWRRLWTLGVGFAVPALVVPLFNAVWTGDPLLSPYVLFWPYDRVGFGPGHGPQPEGNTLWIGLGESVWVVGRLATWLHGWPALSLAFVFAGFLFKPRRFWDLFLAGTALSLILAYVAYWTNGNLFGPRYAHEIASLLFVLSAIGIVRVSRWARAKGRRPQRIFYAVLALLTAVSLLVYLPWQLRAYYGLFGITIRPRQILAQANLHDALVIVRTADHGWKDYAVLFALNSPALDDDVVYASECGVLTDSLIEQYPGRAVYYFDGENVHLYRP